MPSFAPSYMQPVSILLGAKPTEQFLFTDPPVLGNGLHPCVHTLSSLRALWLSGRSLREVGEAQEGSAVPSGP